MMNQRTLVLALAAAFAAAPVVVHSRPPSAVIPAKVHSVEFIGMPAPESVQERAKAYTTASVVVTYANGESRVFPLSYQPLHYNTDTLRRRYGGTAL